MPGSAAPESNKASRPANIFCQGMMFCFQNQVTGNYGENVQQKNINATHLLAMFMPDGIGQDSFVLEISMKGEMNSWQRVIESTFKNKHCKIFRDVLTGGTLVPTQHLPFLPYTHIPLSPDTHHGYYRLFHLNMFSRHYKQIQL